MRQSFYADQHRDNRQYRVGDQVMLTTQHMKSKAGKLNARYVGPFVVKKIISPVNVELDLPPTMRIRPVFHLSKLKPYVAVSDPTRFSWAPTVGQACPGDRGGWLGIL
jgi:hypothetical protein